MVSRQTVYFWGTIGKLDEPLQGASGMWWIAAAPLVIEVPVGECCVLLLFFCSAQAILKVWFAGNYYQRNLRTLKHVLQSERESMTDDDHEEECGGKGSAREGGGRLLWFKAHRGENAQQNFFFRGFWTLQALSMLDTFFITLSWLFLVQQKMHKKKQIFFLKQFAGGSG